MTQPYPGLRPYLETESEIFFGQDIALQALLERLNSQRFVTMLGLSGCGKSSLLNAGLLANIRSRLLDDGKLPRWLIVKMKPGRDPLESLERELEKCFPSLPVRGEIERDTAAVGRLASAAQLDPRQRVLIIVDQFEELFRYRLAATSMDVQDKAAYFVKLLLQTRRAAESQIYILLAMRSEFLGDCASFYGLAEQVNAGTFLLPKMTRDQMEETIVGPLDSMEIGIEQKLVQLLLNQSEDQEDGLPLLQHALRRTWENWEQRKQPAAPLMIQDFYAFRKSPAPGDSLVKHHLNDHLDSIYEDLKTPERQRAAELLFRALSERDASGRAIRRPLPYDKLLAEIGPETGAVVEAFRKVELGRTFLMPPSPDKLSGATVDISHECLLRRWELLGRWIEAEAHDAKNFVSLSEESDAAALQQTTLKTWNPLAGATLDRYRLWRNQARPSAVWARRYEGAFDPQLQRPLRQFEAAMGYLDASIKANEADKAKFERLKILNWVGIGAVLILSAIIYLNHFLRQNTEHMNSLQHQVSESAKKQQDTSKLAVDISKLAQQGLSRAPSDAQEALPARGARGSPPR